MEMIKARKLNFEYIRRDEEDNVEEIVEALSGVDLDIEKGQFIAILGHNGSGKSTLAKHMNSLLVPTEGSLWVEGMDTSEEEKTWEIRQQVGMVFQNPDNQIVATVVEEDVAFALENMGIPPEEIRRRVDDALKAVGMYEFREHAPHKLSGGQKQRIAIAGVIAMMPRCVVLDEPTAMLDPRGRREVMEVVRELNGRYGITVVLITHHMDEAVQAGRVIVMHRGKVLMEGPPREIFTRVDALKKASLDVPQTIEVLYELNRAGAKLRLDALTVGECADILQQYLAG